MLDTWFFLLNPEFCADYEKNKLERNIKKSLFVVFPPPGPLWVVVQTKNFPVLTWVAGNRPYAIRKNMGKCPHYSSSLVFVSMTKSGNPPSENQYFSTVQKPKEPRWPTLKNENQNEARAVLGVFPKIFSLLHNTYRNTYAQLYKSCLLTMWDQISFSC